MNKLAYRPTAFMLVISALLLLPALSGAETPAPQEILTNWANAIGSQQLIDEMTSLESHANIKMFGLSGTTDYQIAHPGQLRMGLDLGGVLSITQLASEGQTWTKDQDGNVSQTAGKEQADLLTSAYFENLNHLRSTTDPAIITAVSTEKETGLLKVTIVPPAGSETVYFLDQTTWLPVRSESDGGGGDTLVVRYSDWQRVDGILFAHQTDQSSGEPQNDMAVKIETITVNPQWATSPFGPLESQKSVSPITDPDLAAAIPMTLRGVHIYVDVMINGQGPYQFIYDSGAGMTVLNRGLVEALEIPLQGELAGGGVGDKKVAVSLATGLNIGLPGVETLNQTVAVIDIQTTLEARIGNRVDGIIGFGFISQFVTELDYANNRLGLYDPDTFDYQGDGVTIPMVMDGSTPHVEATIHCAGTEPITGYFLLDTGSGGTMSVAGPFADQNGIVAAMPTTVTYEGGFGVGGKTTSQVGRVQSIEIGEVVFAAPYVSVSQDQGGAGADKSNAGLIGGRLLSRCRTFLDYDGGRLILEPGANLADPFSWNKSGLTLDTGGRGDFHRFIVASVVAGSPAEQAGLQQGDHLLKIGTRDAAHWTNDELSQLMRGEDQALPILLDRDGKKLEVALVLRDFI